MVRFERVREIKRHEHKGFRGTAYLWQASGSVGMLSFEYVVTSAVMSHSFGIHETAVFASDAEGEPLTWSPLFIKKDTRDHWETMADFEELVEDGHFRELADA